MKSEISHNNSEEIGKIAHCLVVSIIPIFLAFVDRMTKTRAWSPAFCEYLIETVKNHRREVSWRWITFKNAVFSIKNCEYIFSNISVRIWLYFIFLLNTGTQTIWCTDVQYLILNCELLGNKLPSFLLRPLLPESAEAHRQVLHNVHRRIGSASS